MNDEEKVEFITNHPHLNNATDLLETVNPSLEDEERVNALYEILQAFDSL